MDEMIIVGHMQSLFSPWEDHITADGSDQRHYALFNYFLNIGSGYEGGQKLNQLESHTLNPIGFIVFITFVTSLIHFLDIVVSMELL